jgi:hypothetical protein
MAITQQDIINKIPRIIYTSRHKYMESSWDVLLVLRSLITTGWGSQCKIYQVVDELLTLVNTNNEETTFIFDRKTMENSPLVCQECYDLGYLFNDKSEEDITTRPCPECTANTIDNAA